VVLLRALQERRLIETERGRIAVGWLIVEDLAMVLALVLLPAVAGLLGGSGRRHGMTFGAARHRLGVSAHAGKVAAFVAVMLVVGRRVIPWMLHYVAHTGSRELFRLAVLAIALGVAFGAAVLFGVSFALGAFFAGMILSESAAQPSRGGGDAAAARRLRGAVLRLGRHAVRSRHPDLREPLPVLATLAIIVFGKSVAAFLIVAPSAIRGDGADHLGQPGADRRVLLHPGRASASAWLLPEEGAT
jgi:CPA2 family monovalent cation:H+ antiporter-2